MATKRKAVVDSDKLTAVNLNKVIELLAQEKPITKKAACEILGIAYNTTRLAQLIEKHQEKEARAKQRRNALRGTQPSQDEVKYIIQEYLEGSPIDKITEITFRSSAVVRKVLEDYAVPVRQRAHNYFKPELIPEAAVRLEFAINELVYAARYDSVAIVQGEVAHKEQKVYRLWLVSDKWQQYCYQPACELASLEHLIKLGIKI